MIKFNLIRLRNSMLFANGIANAIGVSIAVFLGRRIGCLPAPEIAQLSERINMLFL